MKFVLALCLLAVAASAAPQSPIRYVVPLLERTEIHDEVGQYALRYLTGDGTVVNEEGALKPTNDGKSYVLVKEGDFTWMAPDGQVFRTSYVADAHGYRPAGAHLPK